MSKIHPLPEEQSKPLPTPEELIQEFPLSTEDKDFVEQSRKTICQILEGKDRRKLIIVGPCSIHDLTSAKEFAEKFSELSSQVSDQFFMVMRTYFEKPRTVFGWQGILHDPLLDGSGDIEIGLKWTRELLLKLTQKKIPIASEILGPLSPLYFDDLISWGCIGARTSSSQPHRQIASTLNFPMGFKNNTDGNIKIAVDGIKAASVSQTFLGMDKRGGPVKMISRGNPMAHLVLRGGENEPNYHPSDIAYALSLLKECNLSNAVVVDCSHDNSGRAHKKQTTVFHEIVRQILSGNESIRGLILESHLFSGNQSLDKHTSELKYGVSVTDPCLDFSTTERLIRWAAVKLQEPVTHETSLTSSLSV
ncbi:MAG: 3-deoxy-7-phosphoheptulonate synthase [Waddliaceae bacterium]